MCPRPPVERPHFPLTKIGTTGTRSHAINPRLCVIALQLLEPIAYVGSGIWPGCKSAIKRHSAIVGMHFCPSFESAAGLESTFEMGSDQLAG